jgi:hypothetical protein
MELKVGVDACISSRFNSFFQWKVQGINRARIHWSVIPFESSLFSGGPYGAMESRYHRD